jgi:hypothetical protein
MGMGPGDAIDMLNRPALSPIDGRHPVPATRLGNWILGQLNNKPGSTTV